MTNRQYYFMVFLAGDCGACAAYKKNYNDPIEKIINQIPNIKYKSFEAETKDSFGKDLEKYDTRVLKAMIYPRIPCFGLIKKKDLDNKNNKLKIYFYGVKESFNGRAIVDENGIAVTSPNDGYHPNVLLQWILKKIKDIEGYKNSSDELILDEYLSDSDSDDTLSRY